VTRNDRLPRAAAAATTTAAAIRASGINLHVTVYILVPVTEPPEPCQSRCRREDELEDCRGTVTSGATVVVCWQCIELRQLSLALQISSSCQCSESESTGEPGRRAAGGELERPPGPGLSFGTRAFKLFRVTGNFKLKLSHFGFRSLTSHRRACQWVT
jgi:hypothetical protein